MPSQELLRQLYDYSPALGDLVHRRTHGRAKAGAPIGRPFYKGYTAARVYHKHYKLHRLMWVYHYGPIPPGMQIDHINRVRNDNRIENLRLATLVENARNRSLSTNNTSGTTGVFWRKGRKRWITKIRVDGKYKTLGSFRNKEQAADTRIAAERQYGYRVQEKAAA